MRFFVLLIALTLGVSPVFAGETFTSIFRLKEETQSEPQKHYRVWLRTIGNWTQENTTHSDELQFFSYGLMLGVDRQFNQNWLFGLSFGENRTAVKFARSPDKDDIDAFHADLFVRRTFDQFFLDVGGNFGYNSHSSFWQQNATQWGVNGEAGTWWNHGLGKVEPYIRLSHIYWDGSGNDTQDTLVAGVRYSWRTATDLTTTVPRLYGGIIQELGNRSLFQVSPFADTPTVFPINDARVSESRAFLGGGFTTSMGTSLDISFRYTAEMSSRHTSHTALLGMNCNF